MRIALAFLSVLVGFTLVVRAEVKTELVEYKDGDTTLKGYVAWDDAVSGKRPGIVVVHEWWGLNDYIKSRCEQLAKLGYVAFAADIYGDGFTTEDPKVAGEKMGEAVKNGWRRSRGKLALEQLLKNEHVDAANVAAIGYCFGGGTALEMARDGDDLKGVVSFHGTLKTDKPAQPNAIKGRVLVLQGAADSFVPPPDVTALQEEMTNAKAQWKLIQYPDAKHAFTNPNVDKYHLDGASYNKAADEKSWADMQAFFAEIFGAAPEKPNARLGTKG